MSEPNELLTQRLRLRCWHDAHRDAFAAMHQDPAVMADLGGPIARAESDQKFDRYVETLRIYRTSRWAVEALDGTFLGYAGVMARPDAAHPLGFHHEVGWRFNRMAWGHGYATESAAAALEYAVRSTGLTNIVAYALRTNLRSHAVMERLGLRRRQDLDFTMPTDYGGTFEAVMWDVDTARYR
ncbi:MAG: GNAT family N-acetyltransferase [Hoeflea sp.]|uniref:GNAT family N-acetyltransferase n=1 Tax=Hoeflea sp. TaxID=1940281 RepID=UPI0032EAFEBC